MNKEQLLPRTKHVFWGAGEPDCPQDIKASNGELHTLRCKNCDNPKSPSCLPVTHPTPKADDDSDRKERAREQVKGCGTIGEPCIECMTDFATAESERAVREFAEKTIERPELYNGAWPVMCEVFASMFPGSSIEGGE